MKNLKAVSDIKFSMKLNMFFFLESKLLGKIALPFFGFVSLCFK